MERMDGANGWSEWVERMDGANGWSEWMERMDGANGWSEWEGEIRKEVRGGYHKLFRKYIRWVKLKF
jgi:hypothetical protein